MKRRYDAYRKHKRNIDYDKKRGVNIILNITLSIPIIFIIELIIRIINFYHFQ